MSFKVRLLAYLMLYSAFDITKPEIVINQGLPATRPGLQDESLYTWRTSVKVSGDITEGTTAKMSNDADRVSHMVPSAEDAVTSAANTVRENAERDRYIFDTVLNSEFIVHNTTNTNIAEGSGVIVTERLMSNTAINNASFVDQTTTSDETSTDALQQDEEDVVIDREDYLLARKIFMWGFTPIFAIVGSVCNCIKAHALRAMTLSGSSTSYLKALVVSDAAYNLLGVYLSIGVVLEDVGYESVRDFNVYAYTYNFMFLLPAVKRISTAFTVLLSVERFLAVFFPFYVKQALLVRRAVTIIPVCAIVITAFCLVISFRVEGREVDDPVTRRSRVVLMESEVGRDQRAFFQGYTTFGYITFGVIPIGLVFILNVGIIIKLILMRRQRAKMTSAARGRDHQITRSLLLISLMFLVTNIPALVIVSIGKVIQDFSTRWSERFLYMVMADLMTALGNLNSATNFFILTLLSSAFRTSLMAVFRQSA